MILVFRWVVLGCSSGGGWVDFDFGPLLLSRAMNVGGKIRHGKNTRPKPDFFYPKQKRVDP